MTNEGRIENFRPEKPSAIRVPSKKRLRKEIFGTFYRRHDAERGMKHFRAIFALLLFVAFWTTSSASAQVASDAPSPELPANAADLNGLLYMKDWNGLGAALKDADQTPVTRVKAMNWLQRRVLRGAEYFVVYAYMRELWTVGTVSQSEGMRQTAGAMALYAYALIAIDGAKCQDQTAPGNRMTQLLGLNPSTFSFVKSQPAETKAKMIDLAITIENRTSSARRDDDLLCRGGLEEYKAAFEGGTQTEVPNSTGHFGKTFQVEPPADWKPKFAPPEVYRPKQEIARNAMREALLKLIQ
jgi:hypothetical protein